MTFQASLQQWQSERKKAGWMPGPVHDPAAKRSPFLLAWSEMPMSARQEASWYWERAKAASGEKYGH